MNVEKASADFMRLPLKERLLKVGFGLLGGGAIVYLTNLFGPSVVSALKTWTGIATAVGELALTATLVGTLLLAIWLSWPLIKTALATFAYRTLATFISRYPIEQMHFEHQAQLADIDRDRKAVARIEGEVQAARDAAEAIQEDIDRLTAAAQDSQVSQETRDLSQLELGGKLEEKKPYEEIIKFGEPHIAVANQMIDVAERVAKAYKQGIAVEIARFNTAASLEVIADTWNGRFSAQGRLTRRNAEMARDAVHRRFALAKGAINAVRPQMEAMIRAHRMHDEIAAANARRYIQNAMRTIEIPMVEVVGGSKEPVRLPAGGFIKIGQKK
jgi:hypothetical protein